MKITTPVGDFWINANIEGITETSFAPLPLNEMEADNPHLLQAKQELEEYFAGKRQNFSVPLAISAGTPFQREVWQALLDIPYGETLCYQEVAEKIDRPKAVRAIGQANRNNPLPILVPCHRVIGKNGKMTGYMGLSGIGIKEQLLALEKKTV